MAKNENCTTSDDGNADAPSVQNQNSIRLSRKRHISASAVEPEQTEIKRKRHNSATDGTVEELNSIIQSEESLDDLPVEILEAVLQSVPTTHLLKCRQINQKFNEISLRIMRKRGDLQLHFSPSTDDGQFMRTIHHRNCQELQLYTCASYSESTSKSLNDLVDYLKDAKHFLITSFRFDDLVQYGHEDLESFLSIWGSNIVSLNISTRDGIGDARLLYNLLGKTVPNLKELEIDFGWESDFWKLEQVYADEFQLPNLQVLRTKTCYREHRPMIESILKAAPNLNNLYQYCGSERWNTENICVRDGISTDDLAMIHALNKIHCLKDLRIELSEDLIRFLALKRIEFKVESLAVYLKPSVCENDQLKSSATAILNQIFHSSKDVIQMLRIVPLGSLLPDLNIPKMKNLQKLHLFRSEEVDIFPQPFQIADNFPNLKDLTLDVLGENVPTFRMGQQLKPMPSIKILRIIAEFSAECEEDLLKATPNVTTLLIDDLDAYWNKSGQVSINFRLIANCLPKLQSLNWSFEGLTYHDLLHKLDVAITGLPVEFYEKIPKKWRNRDSLSADELASYQLKQGASSILNLKELKQFDVNFTFDKRTYAKMEKQGEWLGCYQGDDEAGFSPGDVLYRTGFSKVSKFLAFDLMPNLTVGTHICVSED